MDQITIMSEKLAIKELVDTFSIMADDKDIEGQVNLFTKDAVVKSHLKGEVLSELIGHEAIGQGFGDFLNQFETVYHINGQQVVNVEEERASGISYCQVVLINQIEGKSMRVMQGVRYQDEYVKENNKWYISKRDSYFMWREVAAIEA